MNKNRYIGVVVVVVILVAAALFVQSSRSSKVSYTYEPADDIEEIRSCVEKVTGSTTLDIERMREDPELFSNVYRFCLKTVEDIEATLKELVRE